MVPAPLDLTHPAVVGLVRGALEEDRAWEDVTTAALVAPGVRALGAVVARGEGVVAGVPVFALTFRLLDPAVDVTAALAEGAAFRPGDVLCRVAGPARAVLQGERVALNLLQRLTGIASLTARCVAAVADLPRPPAITDTRKTTPGLRVLEKYAVRVGGGRNHRGSLADGILIKDNHLALWRAGGGTLAGAVTAARAAAPHTLRVEVECETLEEVREAVAAGADIVLCDNMTPAMLAEAVRLVAGRALVEASGGIQAGNIREVPLAGVDLISLGALTHSAPAADLSLELRLV